MNRRWKEVVITVSPAWLEVIAEPLQSLGFSGLWIEEAAGRTNESVVRCYLAESQWRPALSDEIKSRLKALAPLFSLAGEQGRVEVRTIDEEDWASNWLPFFVPFKIGHVWIRSSRKSVVLERGERELVIDPGQAFGTGHHETTRLCMEAIRGLRGELKDDASVLDLGTGTGILAMFAYMLGLKNVIAADIDPVAVETARKNLQENRVPRSVRLMTGSLSALNRPFDLVVANLSFPVLKDLTPLLAHRLTKGGRLVVSGVLADDVSPLCRNFSTEGLRRKDVSLLNDWACVVYEPTSA